MNQKVLSVFLLAAVAMPIRAGIVPDGSVVKSEASAPSLPPPGQRPRLAHPGGTSEPATKSEPVASVPRPSPSHPAEVLPANGEVGGDSGASAGRDLSVTDPADSGQDARLAPLTPVEPPASSNSLLWAVLAGFVLLALASAWRSRQLPAAEFEE